jgi:gamma-glutamyltranspeptidase/glutathione hydrolase
MVATANPLATDAGDTILRRGGAAIDATVAVQMMLKLVEPQSSGIGGGAFMLVHDAGRKALVAGDRALRRPLARRRRFAPRRDGTR